MGENRQSAVSSFRSSPPPFEKSLAAMAEFFSKGPQSNFTKMSKQFAQEQVIQQAVMDYAAEKEAEEQLRREHLMAQEVAAKGNNNDDDEEDWDALLEDDEISNKLMEQRFAELRGE